MHTFPVFLESLSHCCANLFEMTKLLETIPKEKGSNFPVDGRIIAYFTRWCPRHYRNQNMVNLSTQSTMSWFCDPILPKTCIPARWVIRLQITSACNAVRQIEQFAPTRHLIHQESIPKELSHIWEGRIFICDATICAFCSNTTTTWRAL